EDALTRSARPPPLFSPRLRGQRRALSGPDVQGLPPRRQCGAARRQGRPRGGLPLRVLDARQPLLRLVRRHLRPLHRPRRRPRRLPGRQPHGHHPQRPRRPPPPAGPHPAPPPGALGPHTAGHRQALQPLQPPHLLDGRVGPRAVLPGRAQEAHLPRALLQLAQRRHSGVAGDHLQPVRHQPQPQPPHRRHPPMFLSKFADQVYLWLSHNNLTGPVPAGFASVNFAHLDLSRNDLTGDASGLLGRGKELQYIDLSRNAFDFDLSGVVLPEQLYFVDVSHNAIHGSIPAQVANLSNLQFFNVSYNRLCGPVPTGGTMARFDLYNFQHNKCLCGAPLPACKK
ncbi:hypothetical protein CFC21_043913, partial [Triticum aestivum]